VYSTIATQTAVAQFESSWSLFKSTKIYGGASYTFDFAELTTYGGKKNENTLAMFASLLQPVSSIEWKFVVHLRQEFLSSYHSPFLFGFSAEGKVAGPFSLKASFSKNFRAPTMNERFWYPGGNPDLDPENSWNTDISLDFQKLHGESSLSFRLTAHNSIITDWILWIPGENYWSAENVRKVWVRGFEITGEQDITAGKVRLLFKESYAYTLSTNENEISGNDEAYKKQLIYTPVHKGLFKAYIGWKGFGVTVRNTITGKVYTTRDNSSELPGYYLLEVIITKKWVFGGRFPVSFAINTNNLLNEEYQVTPFRPMPGISIVGSATLDLNILKNK